MSAAITIVATLLVVLVLRNLVPRLRQRTYLLRHRYGIHTPQFARDSGQLLGPPLVSGNRVTTLVNGDRVFPAMLAAIRSARHSITFETFIYWSGAIGATFADALAERARAGVHVHVIVDWIGGSRMDDGYLQALQAAGAEVVRYHPVRWYTLDRLNNRTHRKLLVIDGRVGFTGGVGIADQWLGDAHDPEHWRDTHYQVEGPVVAQLQAAFMDNWLQTRGTVLQGEEYFPRLTAVGDQCAQVFKSSAREGSASVRLMYLMAMAAARQSIQLASAYFVPDDEMVAELVRARTRGVEVDILVPGDHIDTRVVRAASRSRWGPLLEAGVRIWEYRPTMMHSKVCVVDGYWSSVGSTNLDDRSFRLNDEANLNVFDAAFAAVQGEHLAQDRRQARQVRLGDLRRQPWPRTLVEHVLGMLRFQL